MIASENSHITFFTNVTVTATLFTVNAIFAETAHTRYIFHFFVPFLYLTSKLYTQRKALSSIFLLHFYYKIVTEMLQMSTCYVNLSGFGKLALPIYEC